MYKSRDFTPLNFSLKFLVPSLSGVEASTKIGDVVPAFLELTIEIAYLLSQRVLHAFGMPGITVFIILLNTRTNGIFTGNTSEP